MIESILPFENLYINGMWSKALPMKDGITVSLPDLQLMEEEE